MAGSRGRWLGFALIAAGVIFLLDSTGTLDMGDVFRTFWPVLLVLWGITLLTRSGARRRSWDAPSAPAPAVAGTVSGDPGESLESSNVFGDVDIRVTSRAFRGGSATTVFGDITVDCQQGGLADGEQSLSVSGVFGDARVIVPPGVALDVTAHTLAGDASVLDQKRSGISSSVTYVTPGYASAPKRLRLRVSQVFGDINVSR
ncbi:MAG TPA: cell wall-active antibiotics response protein LiaF [Bacteroidota bacterium]|nr:cell wall-active antibiotics response protein LiaF [Bacteroidota bacterium]